MNPDTKKAVDFGMSGLAAVAIFYLVSIVPMHELGHAAVCMHEGHEPVLTFNGRLGIQCDGIGFPREPYYVMGGVFGMGAAAMLYLTGRIVHASVLLLAAIPLGIMEAGTAVLETWVHYEYVQDPQTSLLAFIPAVYVGIMLVACRHNRMVRKLLAIP
ncbi:MAG: hypothetical protein OXI27_07370 [Thaumarchaeota archaeon]|nr:hypothetical protein [Nitrososphaerota archaeon]